MAQFDIQTITAQGAQLHAAALERNKAIYFSRVAIGDGAAPATPATATSLTHQLFDTPVTTVIGSEETPTQTIVRAAFVNTGAQSNFNLAEIGIYAALQGEEQNPILYAYFHADPADYIPAVSAGSIVQQSLDLSIITGTATVLYTTDPLAPATMSDIYEAKTRLETIVNQFTETKIQELQAIVNSLDSQLAVAVQDLETHAAGYVNRSGDTMTGDLIMDAGASLIGSATAWNGWTIYTSLNDLGEEISETSTLSEICAAMANKSALVLDVSATIAAAPLPSGVLEIRKSDGGACTAQFSDGSGFIFSAAAAAGEDASPWRSAMGAVPGQGSFTFSQTVPIGWLPCDGRTVSRTTYSALFAAIGTTYGAGDGSTTFNLPDTRGLFLRGFDAAAGIDAERQFGSVQQAAAPNISGTFVVDDMVQILGTTGCVSTIREKPYGYDASSSTGWQGGEWRAVINAATSSQVYKDGVTEVRPINLPVIHIIKY